MEVFWLVIVTGMLIGYVVLDGFDFGVGMLYLLVARSEDERRTALSSIGPIWSGNEVWLIASGGLLFFAFPRAYASGFSGFYLALIIVLWLFILRGLALELRSHMAHPIWTGFWDVGFAVASGLLAIVFGAALGNLIRGVPLDADGYFFTALWTDFTVGPEPGILDWYTVLVAMTTAALLALHGAYFLVMKTTGELASRSRRVATRCEWVAVPMFGITAGLTPWVQPVLSAGFAARPIGLVFPVVAVLALAGGLRAHSRGREVAAFACSSGTLIATLVSAAWGLFPNLLLSSGDPAHSLTIYNAAASTHGLTIGLGWFAIGFSLVLAYSLYVHRLFWGKVAPASTKSSY